MVITLNRFEETDMNKIRYAAYEHANDLRGDFRRWYIAYTYADGTHAKPSGGMMDEAPARKVAARLNAEAARRFDAAEVAK